MDFYQERSWTEISLSNYIHNLKEIQKFSSGKSVMQIVKADAYGHGAYEIAKTALNNGVCMLGVANVDEGSLLRYQNIDAPILILSPALFGEIPEIIENRLIPSIGNVDFAIKLNQIAESLNRTITVHLNIDTGMGRSGIEADRARELINSVRKLSCIRIEGIFSHYAASENDKDYTNNQLILFQKLIAEIGIELKYLHISNSSGVISQTETYSNLVRLGILTYGIYTDNAQKKLISLKPVMSFKSRVSHLKTAQPGQSIGYNRTYISDKAMKYAIIPVGYADGYDFLLSNKSHVLVNSQLCKVLGKISMDMTAIDVSQIAEIKVNDEVTLIGDNPHEITAEYLSSLYNGSSYELLCQIGRRAKRYFWFDGKIISNNPILRRDFFSQDFSDKKLNTIIESAITQRLQSEEIGKLVYSEILRKLFSAKDRNISYRSDFRHSIEFTEPDNELRANYYLVKTSLRFKKLLHNDNFLVVCANNSDALAKYFLRKDVEYRWLLDSGFELEDEAFRITKGSVNEISLDYSSKISNSCLEIRFSSPQIKELISQEVEFAIDTLTYYPKSSHQLSVYISELTKGVKITFLPPDDKISVESIPIFSGQSKFPDVTKNNKSICLSTQPQEWVFPNSGVVFAY